MTHLNIAVSAVSPDLCHAAQRLAKKLNLPYLDTSEQEYFNFILILSETGLLLQHTKKKGLGNLQIDFLAGKIGYRLQHLYEQKQLLAKAMGEKPNLNIRILDLTAGLGNDGFILAQLGYSITLLERSAIIATLLKDGISRAISSKKYLHTDIPVIQIEAAIYLNELKQTKTLPHIIYLDPMYPHSKKSALAKREMRFLREIVGPDTDSEILLSLAMTYALHRIVVKRPRLADYLAKLKPHHSLYGKQHRFDVYLTPAPKRGETESEFSEREPPPFSLNIPD